MKKTILKNEKYLVQFLTSHRFNYQVIQDGWAVELKVNSSQELFNIGKMFGDFLASNPQLISIEELEQRGDIPGL